jgi:serine phosphatase RsbU (regulator of sigma subunit)
MRSYADERDNKFGLYISTSVNTTFLSLLNMNDELEKAYKECIDYVHQYFPEESAASDYLGLARLYYNNNQFGKVMDIAKKAMKEPHLNDTHRQIALAYICIAYSNLPEKERDLKTFNQYYQEFKEFKEKTGRETGMNDIVDYNYYLLNHQPLKALEAAKSMKIPVNRLIFMAGAYEKLDSFRQAYYAMTQYRKLTDSLNTAESKKQATEHTLQLNIARAENEAKDLRIEKQLLELEQKNEEILAIVIICVIVAGFLIFFFYRRQKHLREIQTAYNKLEDAYGKLEATTKAKERIDSELRIAHNIQEGMVPRTFPAFPDRNDIDLFASMTPAKEVGGDLYDFFLLPPSLRDGDERLCFCIGDVSGKGVPASLFMSVVVNLFRIVAKEGKTPAQIATKVNEAVAADNENGMFATMFIGEIDLRTGVLEYCNCGHNPPVVGGQFLEMPESNAPIGLWPGLEFVGHTVEGMKGKMLLLYTDGVTEAENMDQKQTGDDWLIDILKDHPMDNAREMIGDILREVATHVGDAEPSDDITLLCLQI